MRCCACCCNGGAGDTVTEAQFMAGVLETLTSLNASIQALTAAVAQQQDEPPLAAYSPEMGICQHPEDARTDFGGMGGSEEWQCRLCGYRETKTP